ncbi:serine/threonine protein kinase [Streptomyces sp. NPDC091268]|uniref:serine/threonine protein kinase n=1 Tax=Streptomyces sp. NPDC091268 TaxID=3365979 RepID=UPI00381A72FD
MEDYAGRILAERYRLPLPPSDAYELVETRAFDTRSGQEVLVRQVPLPEVVDAELLDGPRQDVTGPGAGPGAGRRPVGELPAVRRAIAAAQAAASVPDHPRLDQVFDVFAEGGSLWIVSELVPARPLAALVAEEPLGPYRAAEVASDVLTALRVLHAHGWTHRNITLRTVLICDDGRVVLTGLAAGAAEEALCGYDPVPDPAVGVAHWGPSPGPTAAPSPPAAGPAGRPEAGPGGFGPAGHLPAARSGGDPGAGGFGPAGQLGAGPGAGADRPAGREPGAGAGPRYAPLVAPGYDTGPRYDDHITPDRGEGRPELRAAARAGAIAAYRAGAQAAARAAEQQRKAGPEPLAGPAPESEARPEGSNLPRGYSYPYGGPEPGASRPGATPRPDQPPDAGPQRPALPAPLALPHGYRQADPRPGTRTPEPPGPGADLPAAAPGPAEAHPDAAYGYPPVQDGGRGEASGGYGPRSGLDAERARQTRMAVVGAVTERWAPEQAGPVHGHWQLAAPVGPATDLWALGALLYRAVQGHAPYPEDSVAELVEMVCAEPPAFAEECGPLRPIVESLLRQDPTERPDFEELRGWLRSLVRSAPEPEGAGFGYGFGPGMLPAAEADPAKLPVVRRRGDLHGRHRNPAAPRAPRSLGRSLLLGILALLAAAVAYALFFMPRAADTGGAAGPPARQSPSPTGTSAPPATATSAPAASPPESRPAPQTNAPAPAGYTTQQDPEHFEILVPSGWERRGVNESGQVRYTDGAFALTVVPGRDKVEGANPDPATYQKDKEPELGPYRSSTWSSVSDIRSTKVGNQLRVTGRYTWIDGTGRSVVARNFVVALGGSYHVVLVTGPQDQEGKVTEVFERATASYKTGG